MIAHSIIDTPMTPAWQGVLLAIFLVGIVFARSSGWRALKQVFANTRVNACIFLAIVCIAWNIAAGKIASLTYAAIGMIAVAVVLEAIDRRRSRVAASLGQSEYVAG